MEHKEVSTPRLEHEPHVRSHERVVRALGNRAVMDRCLICGHELDLPPPREVSRMGASAVFVNAAEQDLYDGNEKNREEVEVRDEADRNFVRLVTISQREDIPLTQVLAYLADQ